MAFTKILDQTFQEFEGEYWRQTVEWWGLPQPLDLTWLVQDVVSFQVTSTGSTMIHVEVWSEPAYNVGGYDLLNHYIMYYTHHIVPAVVAYGILAAVVAVMAVVAIYFGKQIVDLLFRGSPACYVPAGKGVCRPGYQWDTSGTCGSATEPGQCLRVTPSITDVTTPIVMGAAFIAGAFAVIQVVRAVRKK